MGLFGNKLALTRHKDSKETLMEKGTPIYAEVYSIKEKNGQFEVNVSPTTGRYVDRHWITRTKYIPSALRIGSSVTVYVDELDADGEFYIDLEVYN